MSTPEIKKYIADAKKAWAREDKRKVLQIAKASYEVIRGNGPAWARAPKNVRADFLAAARSHLLERGLIAR